MDMDFLSDPIFSDLDRSDFIGGIDNEALDFEHLEQFMQVAAAVSNIDEPNANHSNNSNNANNNNNNNSSPNNNNNSDDNAIIICNPKTESPNTPSQNVTDSNIAAIATVSARVSLSTTPIAVAGNSQATPHLPESPPDSGSEPPYSPMQDVHGLTLTSRDIYNSLPGIHQANAMHDLHMQSQFTPPHQSSQHHMPHSLHNQLNLTMSPECANNSVGIRVKHESGLIMNPATLAQQQLANNSLLIPQHHQHETHIDIPPHQLMCPSTTPASNNTLMQYDSIPSSLYPTINFQSISGLNSAEQSPVGCMLTAIGDVTRVQVIGTSQANQVQINRSSAPTTPVHQSSSRKRKMSTQLDCSDYGSIKPDPGIALSPVTTGVSHHPLTAEKHPPSPVNISLPPHSGEVNSPAALSNASLSPTPSTANSNADNSMDGNGSNNASNGDNADSNSITPCIRFSPFQPQNWHKLCDQGLQDIDVVYYRVDADKGFNFSVSDDAFVCQKKNHFQITCHARLQGEAKFVKTPSGLEKIKSFHLHFYGVKLEAPNHTIRVEQSQSDRSKKPFYPVPIDLQSHIVSKVTVGRLHFSETTNNNMRKKGRPNPEQRYFQLVVGLHVHTMSGNFPIVSQGSERIIVRASNPGQFESDVDLCWQRGLTQDSIFHAGRVGINTDRPDESLVVHGNLKVSGHIVQPSDSRAKQEIAELDTSVQLRNLQKIRIVRYRYEPEFAVHSGLKRASQSDSEEIVDTGVIAQEVREVIPDAVQEAGSIILPNGNVIENFLLVNKDRILMENIGAVKELCKVTGSLETRIEHLERLNNRLIRAKEIEHGRGQGRQGHRIKCVRDGYEICSNRTLQIIIFLLVIVMAACLAAVSTLYFVEHNKKHHNYKQLERIEVLSNGHIFGHESVVVNHEERNFLHHILNANKTHSRWPNFLFATTTLAPTGNNNKSLQELTYNESGELYAAHGRNDELAVVMEKPVVSLQHLPAYKEPYKITTTAPLRSNKTINSKHKSKWPMPQVVLRAAALQLAQHTTSTAAASAPDMKIEEPLNVSETSSEKAADPIHLPQDFENNSIDVDAQHETKKAQSNKVSSTRHTASLNDAANEATLVVERDTDITLKLSDSVANPIASTSSSNSLNSPDTTASINPKINNGDTIIYNIHKTVSPPTATLALTTNNVIITDTAIANYSLETPPTSNKSQGVLDTTLDNSDAVDLQNLSSNNDSADNPITAFFGFDFEGSYDSTLGRRSTAKAEIEWVRRKTVEMETFGAPPQCTQAAVDEISNCQSVCFEDSNQLTPTEHKKTIEKPHQQIGDTLDLDVDNSEADNKARHEVFEVPANSAITNANSTKIAIVTGKNSHATQAIAKQFSVEQQSDESDTLEMVQEHALPVEQLDIDTITGSNNKNVPLTPNLSIDIQRPPPLDCWKISSAISADDIKKPLASEDFCPSTGKSLNLTYIVPLSRFLKESNIELHLSSSTSLFWTICNSHEHVKRDGKYLINTHDVTHQHSASPLQKRQDTSLLFINVPSRGYFVKDLALRATNDLEKENICQEQANEANILLQYNFRILRDCD